MVAGTPGSNIEHVIEYFVTKTFYIISTQQLKFSMEMS